MMLRHYLGLVRRRGPFQQKPRVVVGVPSGITELERRAVRQAVLAAGAREVFLIAEPMAAAIGVGLPVTAPTASMVVNVGGGTTEIGVIALSGLVAERSVRVAGNEMDDAIVAALRKQHNLLIGEATAEAIKMQIGSALPLQDEQVMDATGRDLVTGIPASVRLHSEEVRELIREPIRVIVAAVRAALEVAPPELSSDLVDSGMVLTGGGSLIRGLDRLLTQETGLPVPHVARAHVGCVHVGRAGPGVREAVGVAVGRVIHGAGEERVGAVAPRGVGAQFEQERHHLIRAHRSGQHQRRAPVGSHGAQAVRRLGGQTADAGEVAPPHRQHHGILGFWHGRFPRRELKSRGRWCSSRGCRATVHGNALPRRRGRPAPG